MGKDHTGQGCTSFVGSSLAPPCAEHQVSSQDEEGRLRLQVEFSTKQAKRTEFIGTFIFKMQISPTDYPIT